MAYFLNGLKETLPKNAQMLKMLKISKKSS